jgi:hypothetical protein
MTEMEETQFGNPSRREMRKAVVSNSQPKG